MKKILALMASIPLLLMSSLTNAQAVGAWDVPGPAVPQGASSLYTATKTTAAGVVRSSALITPAASDVGKVLIRGAGGYAIVFAVEQLLGAIDWVLDPANNQVIYTNPDSTNTEQPLPDIQYKSIDGVLYQTMTALCSDYIPRSAFNTDYTFAGGARTVDSNAQPATPAIYLRVQCDLAPRIGNAFTDTVGGSAVARTQEMPVEPEKLTLPIETVAQKVIDNASANNTNAQTITTAAAQDIVDNPDNAPAIIAQLENNSTNCTPQDFEDGTCKLKPTDHSKLRSAEGRPVGKVVNDIQKARDSDIFIQTNNNRFIVRGTNSREHIVTQNGEHITTVELRTAKQHNQLLNQGNRRFATQAEIDLLKSFIK